MKTLRMTCPECRRVMRLWALDARLADTYEQRDVCLVVAKSFRDGPCLCDVDCEAASLDFAKGGRS